MATALRGLDDPGPFLESQFATQEDEINQDLSVLRSREVRAMAAKQPAVQRRIADIQKEAEGQLQSIKTLRTTQKTALSEFQADRETLLKMLDDITHV